MYSEETHVNRRQVEQLQLREQELNSESASVANNDNPYVHVSLDQSSSLHMQRSITDDEQEAPRSGALSLKSIEKML